MENNQKRMPLIIQKFADGGGEVVSTTENVETVESSQGEAKKEEKTYSRDELNKIISAEREKVRAELIKDEEAKKTEAEKLAKMDADEKHRYELEKVEKERDEALSKLNAHELKDQATEIARKKDLDISLIDLIDYSKETADSVKTKLDNIDNVFKKAVEKKVNERLQEKSPRQVSSSVTNADKEYLKNKYKNNPYFKG